MSSGATQLMVTGVLLSEVVVKLKGGDGCGAVHLLYLCDTLETV